MKSITNSIFLHTMMIFFMALICCNSLGGKSGTELQNSKPIEAIKITSNVPVILNNGKLENEIDSLEIVEFENYYVYIIPKLHESYKISVTHTGDVLNKTFIGNKITYKYLFALKGAPYGDIYDSVNAAHGNRINIDSFLTQMGFLGCSFYNSFLSRETDRLVERIFLNNANVLEKYVPIHKADDSYNDTTYLYFTKDLTTIDFSFCKELEKVKKMKLYMSRFIFNQSFTHKYPFPLPARELWYSIQKTEVKDKGALIAFINSVKHS